MRRVADHIIGWMKDYANKAGVEGFVVGISGGIDSALTSTLAAHTGLKTVVLSLPLHQQPNQLVRANEHIEWLISHFSNVCPIEVDLSSSFDQLFGTLSHVDTREAKEISQVNLKSRLRMCTLYYYGSQYNVLVTGTGNKVEDFGVGFFTKYGDGGVDISPIADLYKSEVRKCAEVLGVNRDILQAAPTDGLWGGDDRTDEDQLGATYDELEWAMSTQSGSSEWTQRQQEVMKMYKNLHKATQHKINPIPVCQIPDDLKSLEF